MDNLIKELSEYKNKSGVTKAEDIFAKLFALRDAIHLVHLRPTNPGQLGSGWQHSVLGSFYGSLLDLLDGLIESYQGKYGLLSISIPASNVVSAYDQIQETAKMLETQKVFTDTWIINQVDTIIELCYSTLYKLKNLK